MQNKCKADVKKKANAKKANAKKKNRNRKVNESQHGKDQERLRRLERRQL